MASILVVVAVGMAITILNSILSAEAMTEDGLALLALKRAVINASLLGDWRPEHATPCSWSGITCSKQDNSTVVQVSLAFLQLHGSLTPELGKMTGLLSLNLSGTNLTGPIPSTSLPLSLRTLDLSSNSLSGPIPVEIGLLSKLEELYLFDNVLDGDIPAAISNCSSLRILCLHDNNLTGSIPMELGRLSGLEVLRLGGNHRIEGALPTELGHCRNLTLLGIAATAISGTIPPSFGALTKLSTLSLYSTNLSGEIPPELGNCTQLQSVYLHLNSLVGRIPSELGQLQLLTEIFLWGNEIDGTIPPSIGNCSSLITLDLSMNRLSGVVPAEIGQLKLLEQLYLSDNVLVGSIPTEIGSCGNLQDVQFDKNELSGIVPPSIGKLTSLTNIFLWENNLSGDIPSSLGNCKELQVIDFSHNHFSGSIPSEIFHLPNLAKLMLLSNNLSGEIPSDLGKCVSLTRLRLASNSLSGSLPKEIGHLNQLAFVDFYDNQLSGPFPSEISKCSSLQLLDGHGNGFSGSLPMEIGLLSKLQTLDLSENSFSGAIPSEIGRIHALNKLSLSSNNFSGSIPSELVGCEKLSLLNLSHNQLSGAIPVEIGTMSSLEIALDLSWNSLTSEIPMEFSQLTQLQLLDVSHNHLTGSLQVLESLDSLTSLNISVNRFKGSIPNTPFFRTLPSSAIAGNPELYGPSSLPRTGKPTSKTALIICLVTFAVAAILFTSGLLLIVRTQQMDREIMQDMGGALWPWSITYFQKLTFSIDDILEKLTEENVIGEGFSGVVYRVEIPSTGEVIAVKKLRSVNKSDEDQHDSFASEVETLGHVRHRNIVRLLGYCTNHNEKFLFYDYMPNGSLATLLFEKKGMLDWDIRYKIVMGSAQGLSYLHHDCAPAILHRDVKPNNILLDSRYHPYLADFGLAKLLGSPTQRQEAMTNVAGSYGYIAPEYGYATKITEKSDVYSYGVVLLEVLTGRLAVEPNGLHIVEWVRRLKRRGPEATLDILDSRLRGLADPLVQEMEQALGVAMLCVNPNPLDRPTMKDVVALLQEIKRPLEDFGSTSAKPPCPSELPTSPLV